MATKRRKKRKTRRKSSVQWRTDIAEALTSRGFVVHRVWHSIEPVAGHSSGGVFAELGRWRKRVWQLGSSYKEALRKAKKGDLVRI